MNKQEFINQIIEVIYNSDLKYSETDIRVFFHELKDSYHRDGSITDSQVQNWILTDKDIRSLIKITKG